jgi:hypothetical protein
VPTGIIVIEFMGVNRAMAGFICGDCWSGGMDDGIHRAMERDFGCKRKDLRPVHEDAYAD